MVKLVIVVCTSVPCLLGNSVATLDRGIPIMTRVDCEMLARQINQHWQGPVATAKSLGRELAEGEVASAACKGVTR